MALLPGWFTHGQDFLLHHWQGVSLPYPFWKRTNHKKCLSSMVQLLEQYVTQLFDDIGLVGRVHFNVTLCDAQHGDDNKDNNDVDEMT